MKKKYCYFNGRIVGIDKVKISPYDLGFLRGYGVFDVMRTENGKPFLLKEHWKRLVNSAKKLHLKIPIKMEDFEVIVKRLLKANKFSQATVRTVLSGGISQNAFTRESGRETFCILIEKFKPLSKEVYKKGCRVITVSFKRFLPEAKITNHLEAIRFQEKKHNGRALEILYLSDGKIWEASTSNLFLVKDGKIITPKEGVLLGITRNLVIKLAREKGLTVETRDVFREELEICDEAFLTATNKKIVPVVKVDNRKIGKGKVGEKTLELMKILDEFLEKY